MDIGVSDICRREHKPNWSSGATACATAGVAPGPWPGIPGATTAVPGRMAPHVVAAEAARRAARARSSHTAAVAATRAEPSAIRVICQPGMPPAATTPPTGA